MKDLMLDIETMGNTSNAAIIQIGAIYFNRWTGETGAQFNRCVDLNDCLDYGFEKNPDTEKWWTEQNQGILNNILTNGEPLKDVIKDFAYFFNKTEDICVWSHSTFDFVIVQNYLIRFRESRLPFRGARDIRTLVDLSGIDLNSYDWDKNKLHDALSDCKFQIKYCVDAFNVLKKKL